jgi:hypothetical protein
MMKDIDDLHRSAYCQNIHICQKIDIQNSLEFGEQLEAKGGEVLGRGIIVGKSAVG